MKAGLRTGEACFGSVIIVSLDCLLGLLLEQTKERWVYLQEILHSEKVKKAGFNAILVRHRSRGRRTLHWCSLLGEFRCSGRFHNAC